MSATTNYLNWIQLIQDCDLDALVQMKMLAMVQRSLLDRVPKTVARLLVRKMSAVSKEHQLIFWFAIFKLNLDDKEIGSFEMVKLV